MSNAGLGLFFVLIGITVYLVWDTYAEGATEMVKSSVDGHEYQVRNLPDKQEAADLLANIRGNLEKLVVHLQKIAGDDDRTKQIVAKFNGDKMRETKDTSGKYTSYSINKGEHIVFCLRARGDNNKETLMDLNTMMFVSLHEMAHIGSTDVGHTPQFWDNFRWLLEEAIQIGIYRQQDFKAKPVPYCGITITDSPLDVNASGDSSVATSSNH